jgi:3'-phosphoadenosine 5'-phosphosulfate sulfotransferase (PAPS reductase)/FAD synthetase
MINPLCKIEYDKYPLAQKDWEYFAILTKSQRAKFLKEHNLQYMRGEVPRCSNCYHAFFQGVCGDLNYRKKIDIRQAKLSASFEDKLEYSITLVNKVLEDARNNNWILYLAYSGGIDSECCLQLFKEGIKEGLVKVIVGDTTTELPDTTRRWKEAEEELGIKFIYARPPNGENPLEPLITFKSNAIKNGLAIFGRNSMGKYGNKKMMGDQSLLIPTKECCGNLKERPQAKLLKKLKPDGIILGLKATEKSYGRKLTIYRKGDYFTYADGTKRVYPIAYWTLDDEWTFQKKMGFKYNGIYDKTNIGKQGVYKLKNGKLYGIRSGCGFCPQTIQSGYTEWLREYYPKWFEALKKTYNDVALARKPEKIGNIEYLNGINFLQLFILRNKMKLKETPCGEPLYSNTPPLSEN